MRRRSYDVVLMNVQISEVDRMDSQPAPEPTWTLGGAHMARFDMGAYRTIHRKKHDVCATQRRLNK